MIDAKLLLFVYDKFKDKTDKRGEPYIGHLIRVTHIVKQLGGAERDQVIALFHDIIEDTDTSIEELEKIGLSSCLIDAIKLLSKNCSDQTDYLSWIKSIRKSGESGDYSVVLVKKADILDNLDPSRYDPKFESMRNRYIKALRILEGID